MLSLRDDQLNTAYAQVFGHNFDCYAPQQPTNGAARALPRPPPHRPPRPPGPSTLHLQRPGSSRRAPPPPSAPPAKAALYQRRGSRKRIVFTDKTAAASASASRKSSSSVRVSAATTATADALSDSATDEEVNLVDSISSVSDVSDSLLPLSGTRRGNSADAPAADFLTSASGSRVDFYYGRQSKPTSQTASRRTSASKSSIIQPSPPPPPPPPPTTAAPSTAYVRPLLSSAHREQPPPQTHEVAAPMRPHSASPSSPPPAAAAATASPHHDSSNLRASSPTAAAGSVYERLAGDAACGTTTLGKRVLHWARGAGVVLHPSPSAWQALHLYTLAPLRHARLWRRSCAKARYQLFQFARGKVSIGGGRGGAGGEAASAHGSREHSIARPPAHNDPHGGGNGGSGSANKPGRQSHGGRNAPVNPSSTPGGLRAYRCREEYKRWCYWQLCHFYEMGSKYLTSVWRMSPLMSRGVRRSGVAGAALGASDVAATAVLADIFDGRYTVPCVASIDETLAAFRAQDRRAKMLMRLLVRESVSDNAAAGGDLDLLSSSRDDPRIVDRDAVVGEGNADGEDEGDEGDLYRSVNESRRSSEATAATEPYFDVRLDKATGLLHLSLYANGDEGGNGADFVGSSVAACLDNHRWIILKGLWKREVLVFHFHRPAVENEEEEAQNAEHDASQYSEEAEQRVCRRSQHVEGFVLKGVAFAKVLTEHVAASAQDSFVCSRCGRLRTHHNDAYICKRTGRLVRGYYYCVLCHRRTHHVQLPPVESLADHLEEVFAASLEQHARQLQLTTPVMTPMSTGKAANAATPVAAGSHTPASTATLYRSTGVLPSPTPLRGRRPPQQQSEELLRGVNATLTAKAMQEWTRAAAAAPRPAWQFGHKVNSEEIFGRTRGLDCPPPRSHY